MPPTRLPPPKACIFDLDGTLVDSLRDIAESLNACLELLGLPTHPVDRYRYMVGEGVPKLCERAIGATHPHLVPRLIELARPRYRVRLLHYTKPYAGLEELIRRLKMRNVKLGVLSNKPHDMTVRIVQTFWPGTVFDEVFGYREEEYRKPHPRYALRLCEAFSVSPAETWMVGDTPTDVETAKRAGMVSVGVTWGFRPRADLETAGADWIVDAPEEIS